MKAVGTNTPAERARASKPEISSISFQRCGLGAMPSMWRSTASTTTMASSHHEADRQHQTEGQCIDEKPNGGR
jgi:hypothetical protein